MSGSPDWPSPTVWVNDLSQSLRDLDTTFKGLDKIHRGASPFTSEEEDLIGSPDTTRADVTHQYTRVVTRLIDALRQLPPFAANEGLAALHALRFDLAALDDGNKPVRLRPREGVSVGADNVGKRTAKANAVLCVRLLECIGHSQTNALKLIADIFSAAGIRGKQGRALSTATLYRWHMEVCSADAASDDAAGRRFVNSELAKWKADPAWPPTESNALAYAHRKAADPIFSLALTT